MSTIVVNHPQVHGITLIGSSSAVDELERNMTVKILGPAVPKVIITNKEFGYDRH